MTKTERVISYVQTAFDEAEKEIKSCQESIADGGDFMTWKKDKFEKAIVIQQYTKRLLKSLREGGFTPEELMKNVLNGVMQQLTAVNMQSTEGREVALRLETQFRAEMYWNLFAFSSDNPLKAGS